MAKQYGYESRPPQEKAAEPVSEEAVPGAEYEARFALLPRTLEAGYRGYNLVRWRTNCYALPQGEKPIDLEAAAEDLLKEQVDRGEVVIARQLSELKAKVDEISRQRVAAAGKGRPLLIESGYRGYNLVLWGRDYYALHQEKLSGLALETSEPPALKEFMARGLLRVAPSLREAREKVDRVAHKHPNLENGISLPFCPPLRQESA